MFHYLQKNYYFTCDTSIITRINYSYYCNYHTIMIICIISTSNYYCYYLYRRRFLHLFLYVYIISMIAIITLLFALFYIKLLLLLSFLKPIILVISFCQNTSLLLQCIPLLFGLYLCLYIITIITFKFYYMHYFFFKTLSPSFQLWRSTNGIISIIDIIAITFIWSHLHTKVVYGYTYWV